MELGDKPQVHKAMSNDTKYWDEFYKDCEDFEESNFSRVCHTLFPSDSIVEFGYGNGRDAKFFLDRGHTYLGIDSSVTAKETVGGLKGRFHVADFTEIPYSIPCHDLVYSRFTLHSIPHRLENRVIKNARLILPVGGHFCLEARTVHDDLYGKGFPVKGEARAFIDTHYRRFIVPKHLRRSLRRAGFKIILDQEGTGLSILGESDPHIIRLIAQKIK